MAEIIRSLPFDDYLSRRAVSKSMLAEFAKAPAKAHLAKEETAAMRLGSLVHCAILEPGELERRYVPTSHKPGTRLWAICQDAAIDPLGFPNRWAICTSKPGTKAWKETEELTGCRPCSTDEWDAAHGVMLNGLSRELVKVDDYDDARRMADAVWAHPTARQLLDGCEVEVSAFWTDTVTGMDCKARADIYNPRAGMLGDLKTCTDASPRAFGRDFAKFKYHWQDVWYRYGLNACGADIAAFIFIAVEKEPPHLVKCHYLAPDHINQVRRIIRRYLNDYAECRLLNDWPGYSNDLNQIYLPDWELEEA